MRKIPLSEAIPRLMVIATIVTLFVVFLINVFPPLKEAVVIDDSSVSESSSVLIKEGNVNSNSSIISDSASSAVSDDISSVSSDPQSAKININTASATELMTLEGIGEAKAKAIIEYRAENGNFKSIDDLILVSGIGEKTLEKNRDRITVDN